VRFTVRVRGQGTVQVAAHGLVDAERLVEKELIRLWPGATIRVERISRSGPPRIVEEFDVCYQVEGTHEVSAPAPEQAPAAAFRHLRGLLAGSRYRKTEWEGHVL
jgi:hypothetical protein